MIYSDLLFLDTCRPVPDVGFDDIIYTVVDVKDDWHTVNLRQNTTKFNTPTPFGLFSP